MNIKQYDTVLLKDGRKATIVETFDNKVFIADVGSSPKDWETISITINDIEKRLLSSLKAFFMGWVVRVELTTSRATIWRPNQLGHTHHMARQERLELPTYCLEGSCSIQLSYWRIFMERVMGIEPTRPAWKAGILPLNYTRMTLSR